MVVLDTNIVIYYLNGDLEVSAWIDNARQHGEQFAISTITAVELLSYPKLTAADAYAIDRWFSAILIIDVDMAVARQAGRLRNKRNITTIDSIIAATASVFNAPLATRDSVFKKINEIKTIAL